MNEADLQDFAERAVDLALESGVDQAAVSVSQQKTVHLTYRDQKLEKNQKAEKVRMAIRIFSQGRYSRHVTNDLRDNTFPDFIRRGIHMTGFLAVDEFRSLPDPKHYPDPKSLMKKQPDLYDPEFSKVSFDDRLDIVRAIEESARMMDDRIISVSAGYADTAVNSILLHSNGFLGRSKRTFFSADALVTIDGGARKNRPAGSDWAGHVRRRELPEPRIIGETAAKRAAGKIGQEKILSGEYYMIIENRAAGRMVSILSGAMSGGAVQQKSSFLEGMAGEQIASPLFTMIDDPTLESRFASRIYDGEGLAAEKRVMVEKGILLYYYIDTYYGKKLNQAPTTGSHSNLTFETGSKNKDEMIRELNSGVLVNEFIGGSVNATTGDFSLGVAGFLIESGEIVKPVSEMNISGNAISFWKRLTDVGNDPMPYGSVLTPSMRFDEVYFSGL